MSRKRRTPKYCLHKRSGHAYVRVNGQQLFLGKYGTDESLAKYRRIVAELMSEDGQVPTPDLRLVNISIVELISDYYQHAKRYYFKHGKPTSTAGRLKPALKLLKELYGRRPANEFGPRRLKALRQAMIDAGHSRSYINDNIRRIRQMFRWATAEELIPASVVHALSSVPGLRRGHCAAREAPPVKPIDDLTIEKTLEYLPPVVADMVQFERLTGCRPAEVRLIRPCDVDRSAEVWEYRPQTHKTEHHEKERVIFIGPKAQAVLRPYLLREPKAYCFCHGGPGRRPHVSKPLSSSCYTSEGYGKAIGRACKKAGVAHWSPNRLRHSTATAIRQQYGLEASQVILGHSKADVTQIYAERDLALAAKVAREVG